MKDGDVWTNRYVWKFDKALTITHKALSPSQPQYNVLLLLFSLNPPQTEFCLVNKKLRTALDKSLKQPEICG